MKSDSSDSTFALRTARSLTLYLLSLHAAASAGLAWWTSDTAGLVGYAALLAASTLGGAWLEPLLAGLGQRAWRARVRLTGALTYSLVVAIALIAAATPTPRLLERQTAFFAALQPALLMVSGFGPGHLGPLVNALFLVSLAGFRGGLVAAAAAVGYVGLLGLFLAFDHFARTLASHPGRHAPLANAAARRGAAAMAPVVLGLAALFLVSPPTPHPRILAAVDEPPPTTEELAAAYARLALVGMAGGILVFVANRLFRGRKTGQEPLVEVVEPSRGFEERVPRPPRPRRPDYPGRRGRIVKAYLRFFVRAAGGRGRRRPDQTPLEVAAALGMPPVSMLTGLFMDARYGPDEPLDDDVRAAERASEQAISALRARHARHGPAFPARAAGLSSRR